MPLTDPSPRDIAAALEYGLWLRNEQASCEGRMVADLAFEVQRLRGELAAAQPTPEILNLSSSC